MSRETHANMYDPTEWDKIHLDDTDLFAEVDKDFAIYGDECVFGGGKVIRDGMENKINNLVTWWVRLNLDLSGCLRYNGQTF